MRCLVNGGRFSKIEVKILITNYLEESYMSRIKQELDEREAKSSLAIAIAMEAGVLVRCEYHDDIYSGGADDDVAYKLGNSKFSEGSLEGIFQSRGEMTGTIQDVLIDHAADRCPRCEHFFEDD
jgi:hypothetical protein